MTADFPGGEIPACVVFAPSVPDAKLTELANYQGRIKGVVQCRRLRLGSSPVFPHIARDVLGEQCVIKSLNH